MRQTTHVPEPSTNVYDEFSARYTRERHHCNVLCLGVDLSGTNRLRAIVEAFLDANPAGGRFARMVEKVMQMEQVAAV